MSQCHGIKQFHSNFQLMCNAFLHAAVMDTFPILRSIKNIYIHIYSNNIVIFSFGSENSHLILYLHVLLHLVIQLLEPESITVLLCAMCINGITKTLTDSMQFLRTDNVR